MNQVKLWQVKINEMNNFLRKQLILNQNKIVIVKGGNQIMKMILLAYTIDKIKSSLHEKITIYIYFKIFTSSSLYEKNDQNSF